MKTQSIRTEHTVTLQVNHALVEELNQFSQLTGFSVTKCANEALAHWLQTTAVEYVNNLTQTSHREIPKVLCFPKRRKHDRN